MINILIPMAGRGQRFADAGYKVPKPFIPVLGYPMIIRALESLVPLTHGFANIDYVITFLCLESFLDEYQWEFERSLAKTCIIDKYNIISVNQVTQGAACTALLAKSIINTDDELIISDCDHIVRDHNATGNGLDYFRKRKADGGIWCFINDNPKWSYVRITNDNDKPVIREVVEKRVISNLANTGAYYYRRGKDFVYAAETMIRNNDRTNGEMYIAPTYNYMVADNKLVVPYLVNEMYGLGVPSDMERYINENRQFK